MSYKLKQKLKARVYSMILAASLAFTSFISTPVTAYAAEDYGLADNIQDGVILHCFNWKYNDIKAELQDIAEAGFTSVQTSPAQVGASSGIWYWLYQPLGFYATTNDLGTVDELKALCEEADKYGIKVIVDVVANHLAGDHTNIQNDLKDWQYWHHYGTVTDWTDRYQVTHGEIGMPDINSEHSYVQQCASNYVNTLKGLGVDGIRWDAAKHIGLPSEGCNFWPAVTSQGLYHYGEILVGPDDRQTGNEGLMKEYTNYMTVTDSSYGMTLRDAFAKGSVPTAYGNWAARGIANDKLIYWGESHDTWSNNQDWGYSNGMSQNVIDRAYAVAASRDDITALYFSRPSSTSKSSIYAGQKGSTHFESDEITAINQFHNAMIGQKDYYTTGNNCAVVCRETGAVVVAGSGSNFNVTVPNGGSTTQPGTYVDQITGETWTVTVTEMYGKIGSTGIVVLMQDEITPIEKENVYYENANDWESVYAYYWSDSNTKMATWPGIEMSSVKDGVYTAEISSDAEYIIFNNGNGSKTDDLKLEGFDKIYKDGTWSDYDDEPTPTPTPDPDPTQEDIYYRNTNNWDKVYTYYWSDSNEAVTTWPGIEMSNVSGDVYTAEIPSDADYIIFNNGSGTQTDDLTLVGFDKIYDNGNWSDYDGGTDEPIPVDGNIFYQNSNNWSDVYAYYWSDSNTQLTTWPGVQMKSVGNGVYAIEVPEEAEYVIFNNGNGSQTGDLTLEGMYKIYNNGSWLIYN